jgi:tetratricopeptide (TPR) repeat protein
MRKSLVLGLCLFPVICPGASLRPSNQDLVVLSRTSSYVFQDSFPQAYQTARELNDTIPGRPIYRLLYASIVEAEMMDQEDYSLGRVFRDSVDSAIDVLDRWVDKNPRDAWGHFLLGSAYGYRAVWQYQTGKWFKSMFSGLKSKNRFFKALELDPSLYDAYTGIGSYHYWSTVKLRKYIPFLSDNRDEGLRELQLAMDSSLFSSQPAAAGLAWALLNERRYGDALKIALILKEKTYTGRTSLWILGGVYWANGSLKKASDAYGELIESLVRAGNQNYYNLIFCRFRKGICQYAMGNYKAAEAEFNTLLSYNPSKDVREKHKKIFEKTREYLKGMGKHPPNK